jgi:hypothetical protein
VVWRGPRRFKEKVMKIRFQALDLARRAGLVLLVAGVPLAACTANSGDTAALDQTASDIKGGVPANGKTKQNNGKGHDQGAAGSVAGGDEDAGVDDGEGPGQGQGKDKVKKPKKEKTHGANAGASGSEADDADDQADEVDQSADQDGDADESADQDDDADESADSDQGADETA